MSALIIIDHVYKYNYIQIHKYIPENSEKRK